MGCDFAQLTSLLMLSPTLAGSPRCSNTARRLADMFLIVTLIIISPFCSGKQYGGFSQAYQLECDLNSLGLAPHICLNARVKASWDSKPASIAISIMGLSLSTI